jgi:aldose 1-epimerase
MNIHCEKIGVTTGHTAQGATPVDAYTLDTRRGLAITVWTYGATLVEVLVPDSKGNRENVVVRLPSLVEYENRAVNQYLGATLGRYARCVAGGLFRLGQTPYQLNRNVEGHHFHGGTLGFDRFVWEADAERTGNALVLRLRLVSPDGDQGYPGAVSAETVYRVDGDGRLAFEHRATTTASTIVAMTNHAYWNLAGTGIINGHRLAINASRVVAVDAHHVPVGPPENVCDTRLDFLASRPISQERLDHCFVLDDQDWAAKLTDPTSGRTMHVRSDQPGLAVYSGDGLVLPRAGLCLQTGALPDSPNRPDFPSSWLDPEETYRHVTVHEFSTWER